MKPIDLVVFADHSQRLPGELLRPTAPEPRKNFVAKFLGAHLFDFVLVLSVTSAFSQTLTQSLGLLLRTKLLSSGAYVAHSATFTSMVFPLVLLCYFSFFYLLNHGQTPGMHILKNRIDLKPGNLRDAFRWGCYSFSVCFSGGISIFLLRNFRIREAFKGHDHLYATLLAPREFAVIDLVSETEKFEELRAPEKIAA